MKKGPDYQKRLLVPSIIKGNGTGHLMRMFSLLKTQKETSFLYLDKNGIRPLDCLPEILEKHSQIIDKDQVLEKFRHDDYYDWIIFDKRETSGPELEKFISQGFCLGIDEGGKHREYFDYLLDILPGPKGIPAPNKVAPEFLQLPAKAKKVALVIDKILISFGGEDPKGLSGKLCFFLLNKGFFSPSQIQVLKGPGFKEQNIPSEVEQIGPLPDLKSRLKDWDLVFTQFGLTAFEAAAAGVAVILLNPSFYHQRMSRDCGFAEIGRIRPQKKALRYYLKNLDLLDRKNEEIVPQVRASLTDFISGLKKTLRGCPFCGKRKNKAYFRDPGRSIFLCKECFIYYQQYYKDDLPAYGKSYFFTEYKKQYGKTYLEDFHNIKERSQGRLKYINQISRRKGALLDVGSAFGPFSQAAQEDGWQVEALDPSLEAVDYLKQLKIKAHHGGFLDSQWLEEKEKYQALCMWFVIEHFQDPAAVLKKAHQLLKKGGCLAFSTPNSRGVSGVLHRNSFLKSNPKDHFTIWSAKGSKIILKRYGFSIKKIRIGGHHPERFFPGLRVPLFFKKILLLGSRLFGWGDSFEIYAIKE